MNPAASVDVGFGKQLEKRTRQGHEYVYDPQTNLFFNDQTGKWVSNPARSRATVQSDKAYYSHPDVDPVVDRIARHESDAQSVKYVLKVILVRQQLRRRLSKRNRAANAVEEPFVWCHSEFFQCLLGDNRYLGMLNELASSGVLATHVHTNPRGRFPVYRLAETEFLSGYALPKVTIKRVEQKIESYLKWSQKSFSSLDQRVIDHVVDNFRQIDLTRAGFLEIWLERYRTTYLRRHSEDPLSLPNYMDIGNSVWEIIRLWNSASITERKTWFKVCHFGNRLHHVFTYLPSEIRAYILGKDARPMRLTEFDLANAQPAIFANLLFRKHKLDRHTDMLLRVVENKTVYEDLGERLGIPRDLAKTEMLHFLYSMADSHAQKRFEDLYGLPARLAKTYKQQDRDEDGNTIPYGERHKELPKQMQRAESEMFRDVWRALLNQGHVFLPIHDAVYVQRIDRRQEMVVRRIIIRELKKHLKIKFQVRLKRIKRYLK